MKKVMYFFAMVALIASMSVFAKIEGTYVIEVSWGGGGGGGGAARGGGERERPEQTLTISVDDEGEYSATYAGGWGGEQEASDIEVEENEFAITFVFEMRGNEFEMTYEGQVEDGEMSGTLTTQMGEMEFTGKLKEEEEEDTEPETEAAEPEVEA
ncbi:MAG: hypothetical protein OXG08_05620 [Gammaproteobacteria bacterium]|nr:hypothetical protein [Gammaproteobacteria bacterium]